MLDVQRLRILRAVVADGSISRAAATLGYSPSAISQHIAALHKTTGIVLLERDGRGIRPTTAARRLAARAETVFVELAELETLVADLRAERTGTLSVAYFASAGATWIPPVVAAVSREYPHVRLDLRLSELHADDTSPADIEIYVAHSGVTTIAGYRGRDLIEEPYLAVVPVGSDLAGRDRVPLRELADRAWVDNDVARGPCRQVLMDACAAAGFRPAFHIETQDYPTAIRFVAEGLGITVLPRLGLRDLPTTVRAVAVIDPTPTRRIAVRIRDTATANPAATRLLALLDQAVEAPESAG